MWETHYFRFYSSKEEKVFRFAEAAAVRAEETIARMEPWLQKRGWKVLGYDERALTDSVILVERMKGRGGK
jgi:hypothetical protein